MTTKESSTKYIEGIGRRKTSVARVRIVPASKNTFSINERDLAAYFPTAELRSLIESPIKESGAKGFSVSAEIKGGGIHSQAEAMRHGLGRAISKYDESLRQKMKVEGFLKRDPRAKERRKFGLKKARKAPQWSKR
ncbi:MAG TPA: 30S ribosomal protein S9 [Candidatus Paceibacterota bacterium]